MSKRKINWVGKKANMVEITYPFHSYLTAGRNLASRWHVLVMRMSRANHAHELAKSCAWVV